MGTGSMMENPYRGGAEQHRAIAKIDRDLARLYVLANDPERAVEHLASARWHECQADLLDAGKKPEYMR
jgi:hypothetical protein